MSPAYRTHPEFGYLCPSRNLRRLIWTALAVAAFATLAGAFVLGAGRDAPDLRAAPVASVDAAPSATAAEPATATATRLRPPERGQAACEGDASTSLEGSCVTGRVNGPRSAAAVDTPPIAALPLGRGAPPSPEPARATEAAASAAPAEPERAADAVAAVPEAAAPDAPSASLPKARKKAWRGRSGGRDVTGVKSSSRVDRQASMPKSATTWAKQLRACAEGARCPAGEQLMRALLSSGI